MTQEPAGPLHLGPSSHTRYRPVTDAGITDGLWAEAVQLSNPDHTWHATMENSTSVEPRPLEGVSLGDGVLTARSPR